jgi:hypothetical protein
MAEIVSVEFTTSEYCEYVLHRMYYKYRTERPGRHGYTGSHFGQYHGGVFSPSRPVAWLDGMAETVSVEFTTSEYCEYVLTQNVL